MRDTLTCPSGEEENKREKRKEKGTRRRSASESTEREGESAKKPLRQRLREPAEHGGDLARASCSRVGDPGRNPFPPQIHFSKRAGGGRAIRSCRGSGVGAENYTQRARNASDAVQRAMAPDRQRFPRASRDDFAISIPRVDNIQCPHNAQRASALA